MALSEGVEALQIISYFTASVAMDVTNSQADPCCQISISPYLSILDNIQIS